jgi:nucleoside-diphosphate-sugar epimerase
MEFLDTSWKEDLNADLGAFETSLDGLLHLIHFSNESRHRPVICFASSTRSVGCYHKSTAKLVTECLIADVEAPTKDGYGQSKWIGEQMLTVASETCDVRSVIWRIGELAGPVNQEGKWPKEGWLGPLLISSKYLKAVPSFGYLNAISLIPIDILASILVEICENVYLELVSNSDDNMKARYYNITNPQALSWELNIVPSVKVLLQNYGIREVRNINWSQWIDLLQASKGNDVENPAFELLDFYKLVGANGGIEYLPLNAERAFEKSAILSELFDIDQMGWLAIWLRQLGIIPTAPRVITQGAGGIGC